MKRIEVICYIVLHAAIVSLGAFNYHVARNLTQRILLSVKFIPPDISPCFLFFLSSFFSISAFVVLVKHPHQPHTCCFGGLCLIEYLSSYHHVTVNVPSRDGPFSFWDGRGRSFPQPNSSPSSPRGDRGIFFVVGTSSFLLNSREQSFIC